MKNIIRLLGLLMFFGSCSNSNNKCLVDLEIRSTGGFEAYEIMVYADSTIYAIYGEGKIGRDYYDTIYTAKSVHVESWQMNEITNALGWVKTHYKKRRSEKSIIKDSWEYFFFIDGRLYHLNVEEMNSDKSFSRLFELLKDLAPLQIELRGFAKDINNYRKERKMT